MRAFRDETECNTDEDGYMSNNTFYTITAQILRQGRDCKFKPVRKCIPVETDKECRQCVMEKLKLARVVK